jgi:hypothetical protein
MEIHHNVAVNARLRAPSGILLANIPFQQQPAVEVLDRFGNVVFDWDDSARVHLHTFVPQTKCAALPPAPKSPTRMTVVDVEVGSSFASLPSLSLRGGLDVNVGELTANARIQTRLHGGRVCALVSGVAHYGCDDGDGLMVDAVGSYTLKARVESLGWECVSDAFEVVRATLPPLTVVWKERERVGVQDVTVEPGGGVFVGQQKHKLAGVKAVFERGSVRDTVALQVRKLEKLNHISISSQMLLACRNRLANHLLHSLSGVLRAGNSKFDPPPLIDGGANTIQGDRRSYRAKARDNCMFVNLELFGAKEQAEGARLAASLQMQQGLMPSFASSCGELEEAASMADSVAWQNGSQWEGTAVDRGQRSPQGAVRYPSAALDIGSTSESRLALPQMQRAATAPAGGQRQRSVDSSTFSKGALPVAGTVPSTSSSFASDMTAARTCTMEVDPLMLNACTFRTGAANSVAKAVGGRALRATTNKPGGGALSISRSVGESLLNGGSSVASSGFAPERFSQVSAYRKFNQLERKRQPKKGRQATASQNVVPSPLPLVTAEEAAMKLHGIGSVCGVPSLIRNEIDTLNESVGSWDGSWAAATTPTSFEKQYYQSHEVSGREMDGNSSSPLLHELWYQKGEELAPPLLLTTLDEQLQGHGMVSAQGETKVSVRVRKTQPHSRMQLMEVVGPILELHPPNLVFDKPVTIRIPCANLPVVQMTAPGGGAAGTKPIAFLVPHELNEQTRSPSQSRRQMSRHTNQRPEVTSVSVGRRIQKLNGKKRKNGGKAVLTVRVEEERRTEEAGNDEGREDNVDEQPLEEDLEDNSRITPGGEGGGGAETASGSSGAVSTCPDELIIDKVTADYVELRVQRTGYLLVGKLVQAEFPTFSAHRKVRMQAFCSVSYGQSSSRRSVDRAAGSAVGVQVRVRMYCSVDREDERGSVDALRQPDEDRCGSSNGFFVRKGETIEVALHALQTHQIAPTDEWKGAGGSGGGRLLRRRWEWDGSCECQEFYFTLEKSGAPTHASVHTDNTTARLRAVVSQIPPSPSLSSLDTASSSPVGPGRVAANLMNRISITEFPLQIPLCVTIPRSPIARTAGTEEVAAGALLPIALMSGAWEGRSTSVAAGSLRRPTPAAPNSIEWLDTSLNFVQDPQNAGSILIRGSGVSPWKGKQISFDVTGSIVSMSQAFGTAAGPLFGTVITLPMLLQKNHTDARYNNSVEYQGTITIERQVAANVTNAGEGYVFVVSCSSNRGGLVVSQ